jgi:hypothetical protein
MPNFGIMKINFQTMDQNHQLIIGSMNSLSTNITMMNERIEHSIDNIPNIVREIIKESILPFFEKQKPIQHSDPKYD